MIAKETIKRLLDEILEGTEIFAVYSTVSMTNKITVYVDTMAGITLDKCIAVSRQIESHFDREVEDFELEVSSPGAAQPFLVHQQYIKHKGKEVEVLYKTGVKTRGVLLDCNSDTITIEPAPDKKKKGKTKIEAIAENRVIPYSDIKETKAVLKIK